MIGDRVDYLPESVQEMVDVIGLDDVQRIVQARGGTHISIPAQVSGQHWLYRIIGATAMDKLVAYYAGEEIYIPRCVHALTRYKEQQIADLKNQGAKTTDLALQFSMSEAGIRLALRRHRERHGDADQQTDLFEGEQP